MLKHTGSDWDRPDVLWCLLVISQHAVLRCVCRLISVLDKRLLLAQLLNAPQM